MTITPEFLAAISADLVARAAAANVDLDEEEFLYSFDEQDDDIAEWESYSPYCEDAPCCGCCGTNLYGEF